MKRIYTILVAVLISANIFAQAPQKMSYQAVVRDADNHLVVNTQVGVELNIYQDSVTGTLVYTETQTPTTNDNGLFSLRFGGQTGFDTIDWANGPYFLETKIDPNGGTDYTITGASQLLSVPYALYAGIAKNVVSDTSKHYVGELYGGGIVFWVTPDGKHGLIASIKDLGNVAWSATNDQEVGGSAKSITDGASNTAAIVAQDNTTGYAATLCNDYSNDGFDDWYLPSIREFSLLASQDVLINYILNNDGDDSTSGFSTANYWTSTENDKDHAWWFRFAYSYFLNNYEKRFSAGVRAIRAF